jgi:hypothetical protein
MNVLEAIEDGGLGVRRRFARGIILVEDGEMPQVPSWTTSLAETSVGLDFARVEKETESHLGNE